MDDHIALLALHQPQLVKGLAASLRTLIIATFRAPSTQYVMNLLRYGFVCVLKLSVLYTLLFIGLTIDG